MQLYQIFRALQGRRGLDASRNKWTLRGVISLNYFELRNTGVKNKF